MLKIEEKEHTMADTDVIYDGTKSVYQLAVDGAYKTKLPYPDRPKEPAVLGKRARDLTPDEAASLPTEQAAFDQAKKDYESARRAYNEDNGRLGTLFRVHLELEHGMTGHPKADKLFAKAEENGHSSGMSEVAVIYADLVELVK